MNYFSENLLTILILLPVVGAVAVIVLQMFSKQEARLKWIALGFTVANFLFSLALLSSGAPSADTFSFEKNVPWISAINTNYHIGVDGLSVWLVLLTTFIMPITIL